MITLDEQPPQVVGRWVQPDGAWAHRTDWTPPRIAVWGGDANPWSTAVDERCEALAAEPALSVDPETVIARRFLPLVLASDRVDAAHIVGFDQDRNPIRVYVGDRVVAVFATYRREHMTDWDRRKTVAIGPVLALRRWL